MLFLFSFFFGAKFNSFAVIVLLNCKNFLFQAALKAAKQTTDGRDTEIAALRSELEVKYDSSACSSLVLSGCMSCLASFV